MKNLTLDNILKAVNGKAYNFNDNNIEVTGVFIDSRKVIKGSLFIATKGEKVDGHDFIEGVFNEKDAACVISEKELPNISKPYIVVDSSFDALKKIAKFYRTNLSAKIIGVTGSVGKTSTKESIYYVLNEKFNTTKTKGNFNNQVGLPLTILDITDENEMAVVEMGISLFGEMTSLSDIAKPDLQVITNIGNCHLEDLIDRDGVLKAKTECFPYLQKNAPVILNGDDDKLITIKEVNGVKPAFYGLSKDFCVYAENICEEKLNEISFDIVFNKELLKEHEVNITSDRISVCIMLGGKHVVYNSLCACLVGLFLGLTTEEIKAGLEKIETISGRNNMITTDKYTIIDDCYNANPMSMNAALDNLKSAKGRRVAILGDMFELGSNEEALHREIGENLSGKVDVVICIGKLSKNIIEGAMEDMMDLKMIGYSYDTVDEALAVEKTVDETKNLREIQKNIKSILKDGDTILVKASHGMHFERIVEALQK